MPSSTSSSETTQRRTRLPWGLIAGLLLFVAGEQLVWSNARVLSGAARYTPPGPDGDPLLVAAALRELPAPGSGEPPVVLLGSSQVREGLDCAAFEQRLGRACANLAISAGSPLDLVELTADLDARAPRRVSVLGLFPKLMHMAPKTGFTGPRTLGCVLDAGGLARLGSAAWLELGYGLLADALPSLRFKDALASAWSLARADPLGAWRGELPAPPRLLLAGLPPQPAAYFTRRLNSLDGDAPLPGAWSAAQERALERLMRVSLARGPLVVVAFPTRPGYESTQHDETLRRWRELLARLRVRSEINLVDAPELGPLELSDFQDFTHLADPGRAKVSARLAERVSQVLTRAGLAAAGALP